MLYSTENNRQKMHALTLLFFVFNFSVKYVKYGFGLVYDYQT